MEAPVWRRKPKTKAELQLVLDLEDTDTTTPAANRPLLSHRDRVPVDDVILSKTVSEIAAAMVAATIMPPCPVNGCATTRAGTLTIRFAASESAGFTSRRR